MTDEQRGGKYQMSEQPCVYAFGRVAAVQCMDVSAAASTGMAHHHMQVSPVCQSTSERQKTKRATRDRQGEASGFASRLGPARRGARLDHDGCSDDGGRAVGCDTQNVPKWDMRVDAVSRSGTLASFSACCPSRAGREQVRGPWMNASSGHEARVRERLNVAGPTAQC